MKHLRNYPAEWLKGASLGEAVAGELRFRIVRGSLAAGAVLSENGIASEFGTSRSPVREALKALSAEGLIRLERMGAVVIGLSPKEIEELYDVRYLIESFVQRRLATGDLEPLIAKLSRIVDKMELAAKHHDVSEFSAQDFSFHETIIAESGHSRIWQMWKGISQVVLIVMLITTEEVFDSGDERVGAVISKHRTIVHVLSSKDESKIESAVRDYFSDSFVTLKSSIPQD
ncbi:GntR family transcriptional regulator [Cohnella faecalis]|uniref:GntR family transcriptional regulator n=1 Tax=Cohnella faecalis TaxID=2315694 RepID=A0A398CQV1_9BACL|nr:GntR family transcriptional regulator [Cohnella faecalis]RIE03649.1 GntR family transcriptional regulator [Cohnella faecalis]